MTDTQVESEPVKENGNGQTNDTSQTAVSMSGSLLQNLIFLNWVQYPPLPLIPDLSDPSKFSFNKNDESFDTSNICHLFISTRDSRDKNGLSPGQGETCRLGAWYMLPAASSGKVETLTSEDTVILYLHGNGSNRAHPHRIGLYKVLLSLGYYVLALDYRGYGDSTNIKPSEDSVVSDARAALDWLTDKLGDKAKIIVWGHSLGTAIASHMVADYDLETGGSSSVSGLVLESPFNCMKDEIMTFKAAKALALMVDIEQTLNQANVAFETNKWLPAVKCPVLLLHAEDDNIVPYSLAVSLHQEAKEAGKENVRFVTYPSSLGLSHTDIYTSESIREEITQFVAQISSIADQ